MSERIRSILAVAVLTIAIWVWADLEQTGEHLEQVPVMVNVPADYVVREVSPGYVAVTFKGPKGELQDLAASTENKACRFDLKESDLRSSHLVLPAREGFEYWVRHRIGVSDIQDDQEDIPDGEIHVVVDRLARVKVRVQVQVTGAVATAATALPPEVTARVPETDLKALPEAKRFALATLDVSSLPTSLQVEREVSLDRRLGGADGIEATFEPPIVKVTATLESAVTTKALGRFPILISAPPEMLNRYRIVFQPEAERWVDLEVQGPGPDVEALKAQDIRVVLVLKGDETPNADAPLPGKLAVVGLPPSVKLVKALPTVNFNLEKQNEIPPPP